MMPLDTLTFPALGVVVPGGHTFMVKISSLGEYQLIGTTQDDAIGEAFDKVASMLGLPYPGGPNVEKLAKLGNSKSYPFKPGRIKESPWDFSFSGLKTNVLYTLQKEVEKTEVVKANIAASFQETALNDILSKAKKAALEFGCRAIFLEEGSAITSV